MTHGGRRARHAAGTSASTPRRPLLATLAAVVTMTLAACGGLPTDSDIDRGLPVRGDPVQGVQVLPDGPVDNAGPEEIVRGFLRANVGFQDDHEVARSFLTPGLAEEWQPTSRVLVHSGQSGFELTNPDDSSLTVTVNAEAALDEDGYFQQLAPGTNRTGTFGIQEIDGQWRVSSFPDDFGLWLSAPDFDRLYRSTTVNYVSPANRVIIPDVRWFPRGSGLGTTLARAQLQDVPDYLRGAVMTGVPPGARLSVGAVPVESGVAVVDLTGSELNESSPESRRALWAQFVRTLSQVPGVQQITLQTGGRTLEVPGVPDSLADAEEVGYTEAATSVDYGLLRTGTELNRINPYQYDLAAYEPPDGSELPELPAIPVEWTNLAASQDAAQLAAISRDRAAMARWRDGEMHQVPPFGDNLTRPSFDSLGGLWVAGESASGSQVWVIDTAVPVSQSVARSMEAPWLGDRQVMTFRVAADNQRALIVTRDARTDQYQVGVTGIVRGDNGQARSLTPPLPIGPELVSVQDVTWLDQTTVAVLAQGADNEQTTPYIIPLGGTAEQLSPLDGAETIVGVPGAGDEQILVLTEQGRISTRDGSGWLNVRVGSDLVLPGT